jgi:hypothetical protein
MTTHVPSCRLATIRLETSCVPITTLLALVLELHALLPQTIAAQELLDLELVDFVMEHPSVEPISDVTLPQEPVSQQLVLQIPAVLKRLAL